jgi:GNAT superfamily N-acetyltransferase
MQILIREFKDEDTNFILSSWIKSAYSNVTGYREKYSVFHKGMESIIRKKYENGSIIPYIACLDSDPDFILGFAVFGNDYTLHYVFTKEAFKRLGVSKALLNHMYKNKTEIVVSHWCKDIAHIKKSYKVEYNRFKLFN